MPATTSASRPGHAALRRGRTSIPQQIYHLSFTTLERRPFFADVLAASAAARCFHAAEGGAGAVLLAWVLMPDHAHCLLQLGSVLPLDEEVRRLKGASARAVNRVLGRRGAIWSSAYHDRALRAEDDVRAVARYIVANPLRAGLAARCGDYPYWNAVWL